MSKIVPSVSELTTFLDLNRLECNTVIFLEPIGKLFSVPVQNLHF